MSINRPNPFGSFSSIFSCESEPFIWRLSIVNYVFITHSSSTVVFVIILLLPGLYTMLSWTGYLMQNRLYKMKRRHNLTTKESIHNHRYRWNWRDTSKISFRRLRENRSIWRPRNMLCSARGSRWKKAKDLRSLVNNVIWYEICEICCLLMHFSMDSLQYYQHHNI
jgi:hypothetical protein